MIAPEALAYFWAKTPSGLSDDECWNWQGWGSKGYGQFTFTVAGTRTRYGAHRVSCEIAHGPAPVGKNSACHKCHNPSCVNPDHLYWGSQKDNARDCLEAGRQVPGGRTGVTECINGHDYTPENTYREPRGRGCKECRREAVRRFRARQALKKVAA